MDLLWRWRILDAAPLPLSADTLKIGTGDTTTFRFYRFNPLACLLECGRAVHRVPHLYWLS